MHYNSGACNCKNGDILRISVNSASSLHSSLGELGAVEQPLSSKSECAGAVQFRGHGHLSVMTANLCATLLYRHTIK